MSTEDGRGKHCRCLRGEVWWSLRAQSVASTAGAGAVEFGGACALSLLQALPVLVAFSSAPLGPEDQGGFRFPPLDPLDSCIPLKTTRGMAPGPLWGRGGFGEAGESVNRDFFKKASNGARKNDSLRRPRQTQPPICLLFVKGGGHTKDNTCSGANGRFVNRPYGGDGLLLPARGPGARRPLVGEGVRESRGPRGNLNVPPGPLALAERAAHPLIKQRYAYHTHLRSSLHRPHLISQPYG